MKPVQQALSPVFPLLFQLLCGLGETPSPLWAPRHLTCPGRVGLSLRPLAAQIPPAALIPDWRSPSSAANFSSPQTTILRSWFTANLLGLRRTPAFERTGASERGFLRGTEAAEGIHIKMHRLWVRSLTHAPLPSPPLGLSWLVMGINGSHTAPARKSWRGGTQGHSLFGGHSPDWLFSMRQHHLPLPNFPDYPRYSSPFSFNT